MAPLVIWQELEKDTKMGTRRMNRRNTEIRRMGKTRKTGEHPVPLPPSLIASLSPWPSLSSSSLWTRCYRNIHTTKTLTTYTFRLSQLHHCDQETLPLLRASLVTLASYSLQKISLAIYIPGISTTTIQSGTQGSFIDQRNIDSYTSCKLLM